MKSLDRPLATTTQFRAAVKAVASYYRSGYTDRYRSGDPNDPRRYVKCYINRLTDAEVKVIEFMLWAHGVTANTRQCHDGVRGTCVLPNKEAK